ncbi:transposable element Tcb1 transposase [Trichonephila clavipes]|nr:transposable element Tcb1 transposase [Trichonephila clavipes]
MQRDCALRIDSRERLTSFSVEYKTGNQSLFEGVETSGSERCHLHEDQAHDALDRPVVKKTATSCLAEGHLGSRRPLHELPLTPIHQRLRLEWYRARGNWTAAEWNQVVFSDECRFNLSSDGNHVRVWRPRGERLNPAFAL